MVEGLLLWIGLSIVVGMLASNRGRSGGGWFLISALISPLLGALFLLVTPNLAGITARSDETTCPNCAEIIKRAAKTCKHCGAGQTKTVIARPADARVDDGRWNQQKRPDSR